MASRTGTTAPYRALLADPSLRIPVLSAALARLPIYLTALALVLVALELDLGSVRSGVLLACYTAGGAVCAPAIARWIDRHGQTKPLFASAVLHLVSIVLLVGAGLVETSGGLFLAFVAGASVPPVSVCIRAIIGADDVPSDVQHGAFAVEAVVAELIVIAGPLMLSLVLLVADADAALLLGAVLAAVGAAALALAPRSRDALRSADAGEARLRSALSSARLRILLVVVVIIGAAVGSYTLLVPVFADRDARPAAAGVLFAVWGVSSAVGGLWFGTRPVPREVLGSRFTQALALVVLGMFLPPLATTSWGLACALALGGCVIAPATVLQYQLIQAVTDSQHRAEAYAWVLSANVGGAALGSLAIGSVLVDASVQVGFVLAAGVGAASLAVATVTVRRWRLGPEET